MKIDLQGKTALVTGGTGGIGLAIAKSLYGAGAKVIITGRSLAKLKEAVATFSGANGSVEPIVADVGTMAGTQTLIDQVKHIDILVNNLGIYAAKDFFKITDQDWLNLFEINVMSGIRLARYYLPHMLKENWGRIIFISSESGIMIPPEMIHYGLTKSAQLAVARGLAELTKGTGVTVNSVLPGPTRSEGVTEFLKNMASNPEATAVEAEAEFFAKHRTSSLAQRLLTAEEIANLVTYVASPLSSATNGAALRAEGGLLRSLY